MNQSNMMTTSRKSETSKDTSNKMHNKLLMVEKKGRKNKEKKQQTQVKTGIYLSHAKRIMDDV